MGELQTTLYLSLLRDRISDQTHVSSFMQDPRNDHKFACLDFAGRICADSERLDDKPSDGWNMRSVRQCLRKEATISEQTRLMMYLQGGQATRTTEYFKLRRFNGTTTT